MKFIDSIVQRLSQSQTIRSVVFQRLAPILPLNRLLGKEYHVLRQFLRDSENWREFQWTDWQFAKFKELMSYAYENVPGYHQMYKEAGVHPNDVRKFSDINAVPQVTKSLINDNIAQFTSVVVPKKCLRSASTGGSSGRPLAFYQEDNNVPIEKAFIFDMWSRVYAGINIKTKSTILRGHKIQGAWGYNPSKGLILSAYSINPENARVFLKKIEEYRTPIFQAYPSAIYLFAKLLQEQGLAVHHRFDAIMLGSEPLFPHQKELVCEVFDAPIVHWYGQSEKVVLAGTCADNSKFHVYPQYGLTELLIDGRSSLVGEIGEIVGTSFWNRATPFIRYRTGDYATLGTRGCECCGRSFLMFDRVEGRDQDFVVDSMHNLVTLTALIFAQHFDAFGRIRQMGLYQETAGLVVVRVIASDGFCVSDEEEIISKMMIATQGRMTIQVERLSESQLTQMGKLKFLEQRLDLGEYSRV